MAAGGQAALARSDMLKERNASFSSSTNSASSNAWESKSRNGFRNGPPRLHDLLKNRGQKIHMVP
jgi:hypothetical protein